MNYIEIIELPPTQDMQPTSLIPVAHAGKTCKLTFESLASLLVYFKDVTYNKTTGQLTFTRSDNSTAALSTGLQDSIKSVGKKSGDITKLEIIHNSGTKDYVDVGTITGIQMRGATVGTNGVVNLGDVIISSGMPVSDMNEVKTPGFYFGGGDDSSTNKPTNVGSFGLLVFKTASGYVTQELIEGNVSPGKRWTRQWTNSTWSSWTEMKWTDTDTKNTAGSTDTSSKIFLVGATSQAANPQTYSDNQVYAQNGALHENSLVVQEKVSIEYNSIDESLDFKFI